MPEGKRSITRDVLGMGLALALCSSGGLLAILAPLDSRWAQLCAVLAGLVLGALVVGLGVRRRAQNLERLHEAATDILNTRLPSTSTTPTGSPADPADTSESPDRRRDEPVATEFAGLQGILAEIEHRVEVQLKDLAKKSRNLEALIDAMDEPLLATDDEDRVLLCNRSAEAILDAGAGAGTGVGGSGGGSSGGLLGRPVREVFTQAEILQMHASARQGQTRRGRVRVATPLGTRTFQVSALPVPAAWGPGVFGAVMVLRDVTELDQAVQVKADFVANASHELRTPVSAIRGAAETLVDAVQDDPRMARRLAGMVQSHALRLEELLRDLLDLSRLESPDVELHDDAVSLEDVRRGLGAMFEPVCAQRDLTLVFEFERELTGLRTDRKLLMLILRNLVENATKFAFEHSTVRVVGSLLEIETEPPTPTRRARGVARFEVIDRGIGIPIQHQERVFERFYQVDPARSGTGGLSGAQGSGASVKRGTGLGLAIVKHAAKRLGGRVGLQSVWGQGSTFWAEVPITFEVLAVDKAQAEGRPASSASSVS